MNSQLAEARLLAHTALAEYHSGAVFRSRFTWAAAMAALLRYMEQEKDNNA